MPGLADLLNDGLRTAKSRPVSMCSTVSAMSTLSVKDTGVQHVLFPAGFGVAAGDRFDDTNETPYGTTIQRIKRIELYFGAWVDSLITTYVLSDGSEFTCSNGNRGGKSAVYELQNCEILFAMGGLLGFIQNTDFLVDDLMIDYLQFHIKNVETGEVRIVPEEPEIYNSNRGAEFYIQGPIYAFSGRTAGYLSQIQPYLVKENSIDFGLPAPGVTFDDRKACRKNRIRAMKKITISSGAWIEGIEIVYELADGATVTCAHGGTGGKTTTAELLDGEVLEAVSISNSGPFPFCDAARLYFASYDRTGMLLGRRTVPEKSEPALGYEYEYGEHTWIRSGGHKGGRGGKIFAFAGKCGSYIEELSCWVRDGQTGEERLVKAKKIGTPASARSQASGDSIWNQPISTPEHRRAASSWESSTNSSSLKADLPSHHVFHNSPELILPGSLPSSPNISTPLRRLSLVSAGGSSMHGSDSSASPGLDAKMRRRLSGQIAALRGLPDHPRTPHTPERVHQLRTGVVH